MQWEYFRLSAVETSLDECLQELGLEGWELVSVLPETRLFHGFQCLLKRPRSGVESPKRSHSSLPHRLNKHLSVR